MPQNLPPLNSLRAFVVAATHLNFTIAAEELCVTQGAISKQIKILEGFFGFKLFKRASNKLELTDEGIDLHQTVQQSFYDIEQKITKLKTTNSYDYSLKLNTLPSFSSYFLVPKLAKFQKSLKQKYQISIISGDEKYLDACDIKSDIAIRTNNRKWDKNLCAERLLDEKMVLVCSKTFAQNKHFNSISDIANQPFLVHSTRPNNLSELFSVEINNTQNFEHFFMMLEAVREDVGLALLPEIYVKDSLEKGKFINILNFSYQSNLAYYALYPKEKQDLPKVKDFIKWLKIELLLI